MSLCTSCGTQLSPSARFCHTCGTPVEPSEPAVRTPLSTISSPSTPRKAARIMFPVLFLVGGALVWTYLNPSVNPVIKAQTVVTQPVNYGSEFISMVAVNYTVEGDDIIIPLSEVTKNHLVRFEYIGGKTPRPVMAYIARDGRIVTAISVSEHCGSSEFRIKDNRIYCAHCPSYWDMMTMEAFACCGRYYPDPIPSRVEGNEVRIKKDVVEGWAGRL